MKVKTYRAESMERALAQVKEELGPDAVIFSSKHLRRGLLGNRGVEIVAAADGDQEKPGSALEQNFLQEKHSSTFGYAKRSYGDISSESESTSEALGLGGDADALRLRAKALRQSFHAKGDEQQKHWVGTRGDESGIGITEILTAMDLATGLRERLEDEVLRCGGALGKYGALDALELSVAEILRKAGTRAGAEFTRLALVGPTGVGKTTTIAKLAARASLIERKAVGIVCHDAYRVGAVDQLEQYARLIGVPFLAVRSNEELGQALHEMRHCDTVFVDTAGRSSADQEALSNMRVGLNEFEVEVHLTVQASTRQAELSRIFSTYRKFSPCALVVTKLDEAATQGAIVNAAHYGRLPFSYLTTGQRVPEDIDGADPDVLAKRIIEDAVAFAREVGERLDPFLTAMEADKVVRDSERTR